MRKAIGMALQILIGVIFMILGLIVVWSFTEKVSGFSLGLLLGTTAKNAYCGIAGSPVKGGISGGALGLAVGGGICAAGVVGAFFTGGISLSACVLGAKIGAGIAVGAGIAGAAYSATAC